LNSVAVNSKILSGQFLAIEGGKQLKAKTIEESRVFIVQQMTQMDANMAGNVHGGSIMKLIDSTAGIVAVRHASMNVVTAAIDRLDFHNPVYIGELLKLKASINYAGNTSMEIGVRVEAENFHSGERRHTASAYLTFVALDSNGKPTQVPPLELKTEDEIRRNAEAKERHRLRVLERKREKEAQG
jgi:acyl-CoA hydrolase